MNPLVLSEQDHASLSGPRDMKVPGELAWCWQTISALQSMWKSLVLDYERYRGVWQEAEDHKLWEQVPPDNPYGSKEAMLERLQVGDEESARARVAANAIPARPMQKHGGQVRNGGGAGQHTVHGRSNADYLTARIARDRPDIWERMKNGEFTSVAAAAREAGILLKNRKRVAVTDPETVAQALKRHFNNAEITALVQALQNDQ